jgi:two-component system LytT family sensor kinase
MLLSRARVLWISAGFWTLFGVVCGVQVWLSMIDHGHSLPRVIAHQVLVWSFWLLIGMGVAALARRVPVVPPSSRAILLHLLLGMIAGVAHAAWWAAMTLLVRPYDGMNPTTFLRPFQGTAFYQMPLELLLYTAILMLTLAADAWAQGRERELHAAQLERSLAQARLQALELQIQPHFLFNTLNAISALVRTGQDPQALAMISGLADLFRYALDRAGGERVAVDDEAQMLRRYLEIQRLRFPDRLTYAVEVTEEARRAAIPVLLLQPLAENAVRHGIAPSAEGGRVHVRAFREGEQLRVEIVNTGRLPAHVDHGIGLANTVARLEQLYGADQAFELCQRGDAVVARLSIPWAEVA